jgi:hypothetical protein
MIPLILLIRFWLKGDRDPIESSRPAASEWDPSRTLHERTIAHGRQKCKGPWVVQRLESRYNSRLSRVRPRSLPGGFPPAELPGDAGGNEIKELPQWPESA